MTPTPEPAHQAPRTREITKALAIVFGGTFLLAVIQWIAPITAGFMQVGLALILLEVPLRLVPDPRTAPLYLRIGSIGRSLRLGGATMLVVFPVFVAGFHLVYTGLLDRSADWDVRHLARWSEDIEYAPDVACGRPETSVWTQRDQLWIVAPPTARLTIRLDTERPPTTARVLNCARAGLPPGARPAPLPVIGKPLLPEPDGSYQLHQGVGAFFALGDDADAFVMRVSDAHGPIPSERLRLGHRSVSAGEAGRIEESRSYLWLLAYVLIHLGLVAYPEEFFFRGYLMPRLDQRFGTPWRLFGVPVGKGLVLAALAFALLHPILIPGPHRLLVFFPALLFGWLTARQKALGAGILVHAMSNVLLAVVSRMYG